MRCKLSPVRNPQIVKEDHTTVYINPLNVGLAPSVSALLNGAVSREVINGLNTQLNQGQTFFGSSADVYAERHQEFMTTIVARAQQALVDVRTAERMTAPLNAEEVVAFVTAEQFIETPPWLMIPILTHPDIRPLHQKGLIHGFGLAVDDVPAEDFAGRLINNGTQRFTAGTVSSKQLEYRWRTGDPDYDADVLRVIRDTRVFVADWFAEVTAKYSGEPIIDLTNFPEPIGRLIPVPDTAK